MEPRNITIIVLFLFPLFVILWNRQRVKGKMLCFFVRKDKSVLAKLCELRNDFVIFQSRAYDVYPDLVRVAKYPTGWPAMFQELVPACLYDEEDAIPLDWIRLGNRLARAMELRAALDENWIRKLVQESAPEGGRFDFKKYLPIMLIVLGVIGFAVIFLMRR